LKEKAQDKELTGTEVARKIAKESGRGLKEEKMVLNNAVKSSKSRRK